MNLPNLLEEFNVVIDTAEGLTELRSLILGLAVRGKLVPQDPNDEPASELLKKIEAEKDRLYEEGEIRKPKKLGPLKPNKTFFSIPDNWEWDYLEHITYKITDGSHNPPQKQEEGMPMLSARNIENDSLVWSNYRFIDPKDYQNERKRTDVYTDDVLLTIVGTIGRSLVVKSKTNFVLQRSVALIRSDLESQFLAFLLRSDYAFDYYLKNAKGTAQLGIYLGKLGKLSIAIPPLAEQHRIVQKIESLFAEVDELEAKLNRQAKLDEKLQLAVNADVQQAPDAEASKSAWSFIITNFDTLYHTPEAIDNLKKNILNEAVRGRLVPQNPNDEPASELLKKIEAEKQRLYEEGEIRKPKKLTPVNEQKPPFIIPESWEWCYFEKLCEIETNLVDPKNYEDYPHIAPNNIEKETGKLLPFNTIKVDGVKSKKHLFKKNRILYSKIRPRLSKLVMVDFIGLCSADMYPLNPYTRIDYFFFYMLSSTFYSQVIKTDTRVAMPKTNQSELNKTLVPLPPLEEQHRIVQRIEELFAICDRFKTQLEQREKVNERLVKGLVQEVLAKASSSEKE